MKKNWKPLIVLALLTAGYLAFVAGTSSLLPQRVASHFGADGRADGWTTRSQAIVLFETLAILPAFFIALSLLMGILPTGSINLPHREYWLAPEQRAQTIDWISGQVAWMGCLNALFIAGIYWLTIEGNNLKPARLPMGFFMPLVGVFLIATGIWIFRLYSHFAKPRQ